MFFNFSKDKIKSLKDVAENQKTLLISSLLIECAQSDETFSDHEKILIKAIIKKTKINIILHWGAI